MVGFLITVAAVIVVVAIVFWIGLVILLDWLDSDKQNPFL